MNHIPHKQILQTALEFSLFESLRLFFPNNTPSPPYIVYLKSIYNQLSDDDFYILALTANIKSEQYLQKSRKIIRKFVLNKLPRNCKHSEVIIKPIPHLQKYHGKIYNTTIFHIENNDFKISISSNIFSLGNHIDCKAIRVFF